MPEPHRVVWSCAHAPAPKDPRVCAKCGRRPLSLRLASAGEGER